MLLRETSTLYTTGSWSLSLSPSGWHSCLERKFLFNSVYRRLGFIHTLNITLRNWGKLWGEWNYYYYYSEFWVYLKVLCLSVHPMNFAHFCTIVVSEGRTHVHKLKVMFIWDNPSIIIKVGVRVQGDTNKLRRSGIRRGKIRTHEMTYFNFLCSSGMQNPKIERRK